MGTHTPGPWAVRGDSIIPEAHKAKSLGGSIDPAVDAEQFAWPIANFPVKGGLPRWTAGQKAANARLIAAAPTYYEAGVEFHAYEGAIAAGDDMAAMQHYARASQLLAEAHAKATGGEQ